MKRLSLLLVLLLLASRALGQESERAVELFEACRAAKAENDLERACALCRESYELSRSVGPLLNLADCEEQRGRTATALEHWRASLTLLEAEDPRSELARTQVSALEARVPTVTLTWPPTEVSLSVDGAPVAGKPATLRLDPGTHALRVLGPGREPVEHRLVLADGDKKSIVLAPGAVRGPPKSPPEETTPSANRADVQRAAGWTVGAIGAASLVVFAVTGVIILDRQATVDDLCDETTRTCTDARGVDAAEEGRTLNVVNAVALAVGIAGLGTGLVVLLTAPEDVDIAVSPTGARLRWRF
ncbi:MAG TPA: hypothetical protein VFB62_09925 [Polyangiaceae bacterium]|nr:hypothetical protein [Polyangiaceae bacterium]